jgi:hypothetical protein
MQSAAFKITFSLCDFFSFVGWELSHHERVVIQDEGGITPTLLAEWSVKHLR